MESINTKKSKRRNSEQNIEHLQENKNNNKDFLDKKQIAVVNDVWKKKNKNNDNKDNNEEKKEEKDLNIAVSNPNKKRAKNSKKINSYSIGILNTNISNVNKSSSKKVDSTERSLNIFKKEKLSPLNKINNIEIVMNKNHAFIKYNDFEINNMVYELALRIDKRTYFQYYYSLIKTRHI